MFSALFSIQCEPLALRNFHVTVLLSQPVLTPSNNCSFYFLLLLLDKFLDFVDKLQKFVALVVNFSFQDGVDAFTGICREGIRRAAQTALFPDGTQRRLVYYRSSYLIGEL